jgi:hypothetical protein
MAKRSNFERVDKDLYRTWDKRALPPLLAHIPPGSSFIEPTAGCGDLVKQLEGAGMVCKGAFDLSPPSDADIVCEHGIFQADARKWRLEDHWNPTVDFFIGNPPWTRALMHAIIFNLYWQRPTWLLFDSDWINTEQARPYVPLCRQIVPTPRLKWFEGTKHNATDSTAWHCFAPAGYPEFRGRI